MYNTIQAYLDMNHAIEVTRHVTIDGMTYIAKIPELQGCIASSNTVGDALVTLYESKRDWVSLQIKYGRAIPVVHNPEPIVKLLGDYNPSELKLDLKRIESALNFVHVRYHNNARFFG